MLTTDTGIHYHESDALTTVPCCPSKCHNNKKKQIEPSHVYLLSFFPQLKHLIKQTMGFCRRWVFRYWQTVGELVQIWDLLALQLKSAGPSLLFIPRTFKFLLCVYGVYFALPFCHRKAIMFELFIIKDTLAARIWQNIVYRKQLVTKIFFKRKVYKLMIQKQI